MLTVLSLFDNRSRPKGSRDPLGLESIWSFMGRKVVGNLTTVTSNLNSFIVTLLCCEYANASSSKLAEVQDAFLRAEQLCAYLRLAADDVSILGVTRASENFKQRRMALGRSTQAQILSNQLSYGLWGLYTSALRVAGLTKGAQRQPTEAGALVIGDIVSAFGEPNWRAFQRIAAGASAPHDEVVELSRDFAAMLESESVRKSVVDALLGWQPASSMQTELYDRAKQYARQQAEPSASAKRFCQWVVEQPDVSETLRTTIAQIRSLEPLLVLGATIMGWLQGQRGEELGDLKNALQGSLTGFNLQDDWKSVNKLPHRAFLEELDAAVRLSDSSKMIDVVMEQNRKVMLKRGGAAWVEREGSRIKVRVANDKASLPRNLMERCESWDNSYFIGSFLAIARAGR